MADPAVPVPPCRIELPLLEVRTRLAQIVRLTPVTGQVTVITDTGRPVAAIVPVGVVHGDMPAPTESRTGSAGAGWVRRIEQVREAVRLQHAMRITELEDALNQVWVVLDRLKPQGTDRIVDELRVAHGDVLTKLLPPGTDS